MSVQTAQSVVTRSFATTERLIAEATLAHIDLPPRPPPAQSSAVVFEDVKNAKSLKEEQARETPTKTCKTTDDLIGVVNHQLSVLGLGAKRVAGAGQCFFHTLAAQFVETNKHDPSLELPTDPQVLRTVTMAELGNLADKLRTVFDGKDPTGTKTVKWDEYVKLMALSTSWTGELEVLAAAHKWNLRIVIIRRGLDTISVGIGKHMIWDKLMNGHFEPLLPLSDCEINAKARVEHENGLLQGHRLTLASLLKERQWALGRAGAPCQGGCNCSWSEELHNVEENDQATPGTRIGVYCSNGCCLEEDHPVHQVAQPFFIPEIRGVCIPCLRWAEMRQSDRALRDAWDEMAVDYHEQCSEALLRGQEIRQLQQQLDLAKDTIRALTKPLPCDSPSPIPVMGRDINLAAIQLAALNNLDFHLTEDYKR